METNIKTDLDSSGDLWENPDRFLNLLGADSKQVRRKILTAILAEAKTLPKNFAKHSSGSTLYSSDAKDSDDDDEDGGESLQEGKDSATTDAAGDIPRIKKGENTISTASLKQVQAIVKPLMKSVFDPVEKCRELSYEALIILFERLPKSSVSEFLPHTVPILLERLGQQELIESSEEVRLLAVRFLKVIVKKIGNDLAPFVDDLIRILSVTLTDPYHEVRKASCEVISMTAQAVPHVFHYNSERLNKPLCVSITHQQSKVRVAIVQCIGDVLLYGSHKSADDFIPHLTQRLFDPQPNVRKAVVSVAGIWMMDFVDRYSFFHKLMPIIMTGLCDESPDVLELAYKLWEKVGEKYLEENVEEYKDQVDFPAEMPRHYPDDVKRPNFGCRLLTIRNVCKIIPGVINDITDWTETTRQKCAQLLFHLILNCEDKITMHVEPILHCMFKACLDPYPVVSKYVLRSAKLIGYFVPMSIIWPILSTSLSANPTEGSLAVTASIVEGTDPNILSDHVLEISTFLANPDICRSLKTARQYWILCTCEALIKIAPETVAENAVDLIFRTLVSVLAMGQDGETQGRAMYGLQQLKDAAGLTSVDDLFVKYSGPILQEIHDADVIWVAATPEKLIFATILVQGESGVETHMSVILNILVSQLDPKKDAEVRLKLFTLLSEILSKYSQLLQLQGEAQSKKLQVFIKTIAEDVLSPNLVWKAGKTASALRAAASKCLLVILEEKLLDAEVFMDICPKVVTGCIGLLDDTYHINRLLGTQCLGRTALCSDKRLPADSIHKIYPELLKRLDDERNEVRISAAVAITRLFDNLPKDYDVNFFKVHIDYLINVLLVHLDDELEDMQETVSETLKTVGLLLPDLLIEKCEGFKSKHRTPLNCDSLISHFQTLSVKDL